MGILGCGWLGLPLAEMFLAQDFTVRGTTTSMDKMGLMANKGIVPFNIRLDEEHIDGDILGFLKRLDYLIINVPPGLRRSQKKGDYVQKMRLLLKAIRQAEVPKIIFVGSTSVYGDGHIGPVTEATTPIPTSEAGKQLLQCESLFKQLSRAKVTIVRFAGLIGPDRHPIQQLSGRTQLKDGHAPVNLIHLTDCLGILGLIIRGEHWQLTLNAVYPHHPTKEAYYTAQAQERNLPPPQYAPNEVGGHKTVGTMQPLLLNRYDFQMPIER